MNTFGVYISRLRSYSKMTQEQLAEKMEVSKTTIQNWESGRTKVKPTHLKRLAYLFNVSETELISELNRDNDSMRVDNFPYFLIKDDDQLIGIIKSLHLNLNQQELFGLISLYCQDSIQYIDQEAGFHEAITQIPYEFVCKVGSIQFMNLSDGLRNVLKYVQPDFLLKVLKLYPDELFDVTRFSKDLIIEFLDNGHVSYFEYDIDDTVGFDFAIDLKKAAVVLPILEKGCIHLADGDRSGALLSSDVPQEIIDASWYPHDRKCLAMHVLNGLSSITTVRYDKNSTPIRGYLEINDLGRRLLRWFREKE